MLLRASKDATQKQTHTHTHTRTRRANVKRLRTRSTQGAQPTSVQANSRAGARAPPPLTKEPKGNRGTGPGPQEDSRVRYKQQESSREPCPYTRETQRSHAGGRSCGPGRPCRHLTRWTRECDTSVCFTGLLHHCAFLSRFILWNK